MPAPSLPLTLFTSPASLNPLLLCPSCGGVLSSPLISCSKEQHLACADCFDLGQVCAACGDGQRVQLGAGGVVGMESKAVSRMVDELSIKCRRGCPWTGKLKSYAQHEPACPRAPLRCPNANCASVLVGAENLRKHREQCGFERVLCERSRDEETGERRCGYLRKDEEGHGEVCEWHRCDVPDCSTRGTPALMALHKPACVARADEHAALAAEVATLHTELDASHAAHSALQDSHDELEGLLNDAEDAEADLAVQMEELEAQVQQKTEEADEAKERLGEVQSSSCRKDTRIERLERRVRRLQAMLQRRRRAEREGSDASSTLSQASSDDDMDDSDDDLEDEESDSESDEDASAASSHAASSPSSAATSLALDGRPKPGASLEEWEHYLANLVMPFSYTDDEDEDLRPIKRRKVKAETEGDEATADEE
ncbi:hypothetical protein JCM10207_005935 [Rhodosporidiobolus poonsookiae]